ncbi:MAG: cytochrome P450 [Pseudomonadales bacterium]|nr:cytochrome P450 [Pseudomonadales bacterium]
MDQRVNIQPVEKVKSWLPWIGHGLQFIKDADKLMAQCYAKHGHEFQLTLGGRKVTVLLNPHDIATIFGESKRLTGEALNAEISLKVFGMDYQYFNSNKQWAFHSLSQDFAKHLRGDALDEMTQVMHQHMEDAMFRRVGEQPFEGQLFDFVGRLIVEAGGEAMFGQGFAEDADQLYDDFALIDDHFQSFIGGTPKWLVRGARKAEQRLNARFGNIRKGQAKVMDSRFKLVQGADSFKMAQQDTAMFWAAQSNTVAIAAYTVFHVMRDPAVKEIIVQEVTAAVQKSSATTRLAKPLITQGVLDKMPKLDAVIDETLRLYSTGFNMRQIAQTVEQRIDSVDIGLDSGRVLSLDAAEFVAIYPRFMHMHPDIYSRPEQFQWDRFLGKQGPNKFSYQSKPIKNSLSVFGGGVGMCPGRHFARNEFKLIVAALINDFDLEILDATIPANDTNRVGLGSYRPLQDIPFTCRIRG